MCVYKTKQTIIKVVTDSRGKKQTTKLNQKGNIILVTYMASLGILFT